MKLLIGLFKIFFVLTIFGFIGIVVLATTAPGNDNQSLVFYILVPFGLTFFIVLVKKLVN